MNLWQTRTNPMHSRVEGLNLRQPDYKLSTFTTQPHCLLHSNCPAWSCDKLFTHQNKTKIFKNAWKNCSPWWKITEGTCCKGWKSTGSTIGWLRGTSWKKITNLMDCPSWEVEDISSNKLCIKNGFTNFFLCKVFCQRIQIWKWKFSDSTRSTVNVYCK